MSTETDNNLTEARIHSERLGFIDYLKFRGSCSDAPKVLTRAQKTLVHGLLSDPILPQHEAIFSERDLFLPLVQKGMAYAAGKMLQIGDPKSYVLGIPEQYRAAALVTFCRRDDFAQSASVMLIGIGEIGLDYDDAETEEERESVNKDYRLKQWRFNNYEEGRSFLEGISRALNSDDHQEYIATSSRGYLELQELAMDAEDDYKLALAGKDQAYIARAAEQLDIATRRQAEQAFAVHNVTFALKFAFVFNHLYPASEPEIRSIALQHIGVSPDFPWFDSSTVDNSLYPAILSGFSNLNSSTAFMHNQVPLTEDEAETKAG